MECREAYDDGLLCNCRYANTVGQETVAVWRVVFLILESELAQK